MVSDKDLEGKTNKQLREVQGWGRGRAGAGGALLKLLRPMMVLVGR